MTKDDSFQLWILFLSSKTFIILNINVIFKMGSNYTIKVLVRDTCDNL